MFVFEIHCVYVNYRNVVTVLTHARVWVLNRQVFQQIMMRTRLQDIEEKVRFLRSNPLLKDLSSDILAKMSDLLQVVSRHISSFCIPNRMKMNTFALIYLH